MKRSAFTGYLAVILSVYPVASEGRPQKGTSLIRRPAVAGSFYPSDPVALRLHLAGLFRSAEDVSPVENMAALLVPHAGYVFSGEVAARAYTLLDPDQTYENIFLIGTCHHVWLSGASVYNRGNYQTPLGVVPVNTDLAGRLIRDSRLFEYHPEAHTNEHSIEVQLPFLQYRLKHEFKIVPIVMGTSSAVTCRRIGEVLKPYFNEKNLFIISSDFSHYPDYADAVQADGVTGDAIKSNLPENFLKAIRENESRHIPGLSTSACGQGAILTLMYLSSETPGMEVRHVSYMNSGDTDYGDKRRVVGYHSFAYTRKKDMAGFSLSTEEKVQLLKLANDAIRSRLQNRSLPEVDPSGLSGPLKASCGAFVSLHKKGELRGCIGQILATGPLYEVVQKMAIAAAFRDFRFNPVQPEEMKDIDMEISVLSPLKRLDSIDAFELGKHGIYMVKGDRSGTFLPQVAAGKGWSKEEFLGYCARDKAGIGWNGWKDAELYTYEVLVFSGKELLNAEP